MLRFYDRCWKKVIARASTNPDPRKQGASSDEDDEAAGLKDSEYKGKHKSKRASKKKHKR
eukprot:1158133-Pelagomonas_calceolata.AAC.4